MTNTLSPVRDWAGGARGYILAWGTPTAAMVGALFVAVPARIAIWSLALAWMGIACLLNARRCGRTHCRYTGPYYLVAIIPVLALGIGAPSSGPAAWIVLGAGIVGGGKLIWWASERARGKYS